METILPYIGYVASAIVLLSFVSKDIILIRTLAAIGALIFTFYCAMRNDPILSFLNLAIAAINMFHLYKLTRK